VGVSVAFRGVGRGRVGRGDDDRGIGDLGGHGIGRGVWFGSSGEMWRPWPPLIGRLVVEDSTGKAAVGESVAVANVDNTSG
jgi:hypothetical protein